MTTATAPQVRNRRAAARRGASLAGTGTLIRFVLRRDRIRIPVWIVSLTVITASTAASFPSLYLTAEDRQSRAALMSGNPASIAMSGPGHGLDDYTFGAMMTNEVLGFIAIFVALMSVLLVVRHTRTEEEAGRAELIRAGVVGRHAHTTAAVTVVIATNIALALLIAVSLGGAGVESITWSGSFLFGAALAGVGITFTALAAISAQVNEHARAASGLAGALIAVAFLLRAVGDMGSGVLSWLSPIGWAQATRAYVDDTWWPVLLAVGVSAVLFVIAYALSTRRDVGAGLVAQRPGPATGAGSLGTPLGLALRLQRGSLIAWAAAMFLFGAVYGSLIEEVESFAADNEAVAEMIPEGAGGALIDGFVAMIVSMLAVICSVFAIQATLRARSEETSGRAEPLLSTRLSRTRWLAGHLTVALVGGAVVLVLSGLGLGLSAGLAGGDMSLLGRVTGAAVAYVPALWFIVGIATLLFGFLPRAVVAVWAVLVLALTVSMLGALLQLPDWTFDLSPFAHVPQLPSADFTATPLVVLTALAAALIALGIWGFRRRDVYTN